MANQANNKGTEALKKRWAVLAGINQTPEAKLNETTVVQRNNIFKIVTAKNKVTYGIIKEGYKYHIKIAKNTDDLNNVENYRDIVSRQHNSVNSFVQLSEAEKTLNMRLLAINEDYSDYEEPTTQHQEVPTDGEAPVETSPESEYTSDGKGSPESDGGDDIQMDMDNLGDDEQGDNLILSLLGKLTGEIRQTENLTPSQIKNILNSVISAVPFKELDDEDRKSVALRILKGGKKSKSMDEADLNEEISDQEVSLVKGLSDNLLKADKTKMTRDMLVKSLEDVIGKVKSVDSTLKTTLGEEKNEDSEDEDSEENVDLFDTANSADLMGDDNYDNDLDTDDITLDLGLDADTDTDDLDKDSLDVIQPEIGVNNDISSDGLSLEINFSNKSGNLSGSEAEMTKIIQQLVAEEKGLKPRKLSESKNEKIQALRKKITEEIANQEIDSQSKVISTMLKESFKNTLDKETDDKLQEMIKKRFQMHKAGKKLTHNENKLFKAIDETIESCYKKKA